MWIKDHKLCIYSNGSPKLHLNVFSILNFFNFVTNVIVILTCIFLPSGHPQSPLLHAVYKLKQLFVMAISPTTYTHPPPCVCTDYM